VLRAYLDRATASVAFRAFLKAMSPLVEEDCNHLALLQLASGLIGFKKARAATAATALPG
jgi:hypothetical protein